MGKYFEKMADLIIGPKDGSIVSGGLFIGTDPDYKLKAKELRELVGTHKSLRKTKEAWNKKYPEDFATLAFKTAKEPKAPLLFGKDKYKKDLEFYKDTTTKPRIFLRVGEAGSRDQSIFYTQVFRGLYDNELGRLPKKERIVYV